MPTPTRVLILEDEPTSRAALRDLLEAEGYLVDTAARGSVAIERQRAMRPDLLLADLILPDLDGLAVARVAEAECGCAVVMMTGSVRASDEDLGYDLIMKPIDFEELLAAIRRALASRMAS